MQLEMITSAKESQQFWKKNVFGCFEVFCKLVVMDIL